jgi:23S rRNA pseudouridine1911/1915/1917 synthase
MNGGYVYRDLASAADEGLPVLLFYARRYAQASEAEWRRRIENGLITVNGRAAAPEAILKRGDRLAYARPPWEEPAAPLHVETLYEDQDVLVLAKPSGLPVLPGGMYLENTLLHLTRRRYGPACSPLHRLGRGTSGAILFTRNAAAARILTAAMKERRIVKVYLALASGTAMPDAFTVDAPIGLVPYRRPFAVHAYRSDGRPALSLVRALRRLPEKSASLLEVTIPTGRPHQIRVHLSYAGWPLIGDPLYGKGGIPRADAADGDAAATPGDCGYLLHAWKIMFPHPSRGGEVEVVCPPPPALDPAGEAS